MRPGGASTTMNLRSPRTQLLNGTSHARTAWVATADVDVGPAKDDRQTRQWAFILHISMLAGFVLPLAGLIAPISDLAIEKR